MARYTFLLLAFFLANTTFAEGLVSGIVVQNVNSVPDVRNNPVRPTTTNNTVPDTSGSSDPTTINSVPGTTTTTNSAPTTVIKRTNATSVDIRRTSPRNTTEVGSVVEPSVSGSRTTNAQMNNGAATNRAVQTTKTTKTSANSMSCKTYEGKVYDQGEAGYTDCMRNIRTDRQGTRTVP